MQQKINELLLNTSSDDKIETSNNEFQNDELQTTSTSNYESDSK